MVEKVSTHQTQMMTDNLLTVLRGSSRNGIHELQISKKSLDIERVTREVKLMAQERGTTFEKDDTSFVSYFEIHV